MWHTTGCHVRSPLCGPPHAPLRPCRRRKPWAQTGACRSSTAQSAPAAGSPAAQERQAGGEGECRRSRRTQDAHKSMSNNRSMPPPAHLPQRADVGAVSKDGGQLGKQHQLQQLDGDAQRLQQEAGQEARGMRGERSACGSRSPHAAAWMPAGGPARAAPCTSSSSCCSNSPGPPPWPSAGGCWPEKPSRRGQTCRWRGRSQTCRACSREERNTHDRGSRAARDVSHEGRGAVQELLLGAPVLHLWPAGRLEQHAVPRHKAAGGQQEQASR